MFKCRNSQHPEGQLAEALSSASRNVAFPEVESSLWLEELSSRAVRQQQQRFSMTVLSPVVTALSEFCNRLTSFTIIYSLREAYAHPHKLQTSPMNMTWNRSGAMTKTAGPSVERNAVARHPYAGLVAAKQRLNLYYSRNLLKCSLFFFQRIPYLYLYYYIFFDISVRSVIEILEKIFFTSTARKEFLRY